MRRKASYQGVIEPKSMGFKKKKINEPVRIGLVKMRVQVFCIRTRLMIYADEEKAGYKIGDFIRRDQRKNFEKYKCNEGLVSLVINREA